MRGQHSRHSPASRVFPPADSKQPHQLGARRGRCYERCGDRQEGASEKGSLHTGEAKNLLDRKNRRRGLGARGRRAEWGQGAGARAGEENTGERAAPRRRPVSQSKCNGKSCWNVRAPGSHAQVWEHQNNGQGQSRV